MTRQTDDDIRRLLAVRHARRILNSAIAKPVARARGYRTVTTKAELGRLGFADGQRRAPALLLPVHGVGGDVVTYMIRPDEPRIGKNGRPLKYEFPAGSRMALDVHPFLRERLGDPAVALWITEGIFKADAAVSAGLCCLAVLGVWNWRGTNAVGGKVALPDWEAIALEGRDVFIAYDSDVMLKPPVHDALARLGAFLASRRARVRYVYLPSGPGGAKVGLDDFLAAGRTVDALLALATAELRRPPSDGPDEPYAATEAGTVWRKPTPDGAVDVLLANFSATIVEDAVEDDGAEERRVYVLEADVRGRRERVEISAAQFAGLGWVGERLGAGAVLEPGLGTKERLRHAIQTLSGEVPQRRVFAHTGWRHVDGVWVYLHGAGAIGPEGRIDGVEVGLRGPLRRIALPDPPDGDALIAAVAAALQLLELLPADVACPLLGAVFLAPLRELLREDAPDFVLWLHGPSGTFKSEILALGQGFYGEFSRQSLPANFGATPNAVERFAFEAKDAVLAVDDFHPASDPREQQAMNQVANRVLRGAGNVAGRARMRADTTLRPALAPRCLAIASGERLPEGHSTAARMFPVPVAPGAVDPGHLTAAQEQRDRYPLAMAAYVGFLAQRFAGFQESLPRRFRELRAELQVVGGHRREPGQLAHLLLGLEAFLGFAVEVGAVAPDIRGAHLRQARRVLLAHAREQAAAQAEEAPAPLFLRYLGDGFAGKRIYLEAKHGGPPVDAAQWGWERTAARDDAGMPQDGWRHSAAQLVGVLDGEWLLLFPEQTYQFVVGAAKAAGRAFPLDQHSLIRRLDEAGLISTETEGGERRRKVNAWIGGATKRVIKLRRDAVAVSPSRVGTREGREVWEDFAASQGVPDKSPSRPSGKAGAIGKDLPEASRAAASILPALPGLPGFREEGEAAESPGEEVVEWRA